MDRKKIYNLGLLLSFIGLLLLMILLISGAAYPALLFRLLAPSSLLLLFLGLGISSLSKILGFKEKIENKEYYDVKFLLVAILITFIIQLVRNVILK